MQVLLAILSDDPDNSGCYQILIGGVPRSIPSGVLQGFINRTRDKPVVGEWDLRRGQAALREAGYSYLVPSLFQDIDTHHISNAVLKRNADGTTSLFADITLTRPEMLVTEPKLSVGDFSYKPHCISSTSGEIKTLVSFRLECSNHEKLKLLFPEFEIRRVK